MSVFNKATKKQSKLRMALYGVSGSGKTYSSLAIATGLRGRIAVIDTERGSASKYAGRFEFDVLDMQPPYTPAAYVQAIHAAELENYDILIIDSLTHAWSGTGGALEMVDNAAKRSQSSNTYVAWRDVTPEHNKLIDAMLQSRCHIIATMRSKTEYVMEQNEKGKMVPRKKAMAPIQRDGMEYEFDVVAEMTMDNEMIIQKSRCESLNGQVIAKPNGTVSTTLRTWLTDGIAPTQTNETAPKMTESAAIPPADATNGNGNGKLAAAKERLTRHAQSLDALAVQARKAGDLATAESMDALLREARRNYKSDSIATLHAISDKLKAAEAAHMAAIATPAEPAEMPF